MKILYDNQIFKTQKFGGVSRYYAELLKGIRQSGNIDFLPAYFFSENKHLRFNGLTRYDNITDQYRLPGKYKLRNYLRKKEDKDLLKLVKGGKYDLFHPTYYSPLLVNCLPDKKPFVLTVFDMIHELYIDRSIEEFTEETKCKRYMIPKATHIIAISQNTKNDILQFFPEVDEHKISVVYLGSSFSSQHATTKSQLPSTYILYVGNRRSYKNFLWFLQSIASFLVQHKVHLVCAGGGEFTEYEHALIDKAKLTDIVHYIPVNGDDDLAALYQHAACFVFPSLYEGFGIPVLEAFSCGCPVVLTNSSSFPEIAGNATLYFDAGNAESLIRELTRILYEPGLSQNLKEAGTKRLQFFSWQKMIQHHVEIYESIASAGLKAPSISPSISDTVKSQP